MCDSSDTVLLSVFPLNFGFTLNKAPLLSGNAVSVIIWRSLGWECQYRRLPIVELSLIVLVILEGIMG